MTDDILKIIEICETLKINDKITYLKYALYVDNLNVAWEIIEPLLPSNKRTQIKHIKTLQKKQN